MANIPPALHSMMAKACDVMHIWVMWIIKCHDGRCSETCENWIEWNGMTVNTATSSKTRCVWILLLLQYVITSRVRIRIIMLSIVASASEMPYDISNCMVSSCCYAIMALGFEYNERMEHFVDGVEENRLNKREEAGKGGIPRHIYVKSERRKREKRSRWHKRTICLPNNRSEIMNVIHQSNCTFQTDGIHFTDLFLYDHFFAWVIPRRWPERAGVDGSPAYVAVWRYTIPFNNNTFRFRARLFLLKF